LLEPVVVVSPWFPRLPPVLRLSYFWSGPTVAILGLALFGSRARGDGDEGADLDQLALTTDRKPKFTIQNDVALSCYPYGLMKFRAETGDLFVLHVITEGRVIYQSAELAVFDEVKNGFKYKENYAREIKLASDVGWLLVRFGDRLSSAKRLNGRMAWTTRSILIAKAAAERRPTFGARQLAEFSGSPDVLALIENKGSGERDPTLIEKFAAFLRTHGAPAPPVPRTAREQRQTFVDDRNVVGVRLVQTMMH